MNQSNVGQEAKENKEDIGVITNRHDLEKAGYQDYAGSQTETIPRHRLIRNKIGLLRHLGRFEDWLQSLAGVETQGIDRLPDEEKEPPSLLNAFLMWFSFNGHIASVPVGILGPAFGLSLQLSVVAVVVGVLLGSLLTAACATLGPKVSGLHKALSNVVEYWLIVAPSNSLAFVLSGLLVTHSDFGVLSSVPSSTSFSTLVSV